VMPGTSPRIAISRSFSRPRPNLRKTPRGRPVSAQRLRWRVGAESRGSDCSFRRAAWRSSSDALALSMIALSATRLAAYFATILARFASRLISASFAMFPSVLERELESGQKRLGFRIRLRSGGNADVHTAQRIDLVVLDFRENNLFLETDVVVATTVKTLAGDAAEVADTRQCDGDQAIQEFVHGGTTQGNHATDRITFTDLETGNCLLGLGDHDLLAGDLGHVSDGVFQHLL